MFITSLPAIPSQTTADEVKTITSERHISQRKWNYAYWNKNKKKKRKQWVQSVHGKFLSTQNSL